MCHTTPKFSAKPISFKSNTMFVDFWEDATVACSSVSSGLPTIDEEKPMAFDVPKPELPRVSSFLFQGFDCLPPLEVALPPVEVSTPTKVLKSCLKQADSRKPAVVHFGTISIRSYDVTVGDNPSCTAGVPVTCDWTYEQQPPCDLDEYLEMKGTARRQFLLSPQKRWEILVQAGFDKQLLKQASKQTWTTKAQRRLSYVWSLPAEFVLRKITGVAA